jgi:hypothetical protein
VTFLFTDIEGSTRRWETDADAMRVALLAHDDVLRTAIKSHGGYLFSHTGDGVVAAFASPRSAVDAAVAAQRELELPVRLGLATGEAELRDGDYFGTVLNRAARVMAAGHGGQILVADSMAVLLGGIDLVDLGRDGCGTCQSRWGCFRSVRRGCARTLRRCGHWIEPGKPAARGHQLHRAGIRDCRCGSVCASPSGGQALLRVKTRVRVIRILYLPLTRSWLQSGVSSKESSGASGS